MVSERLQKVLAEDLQLPSLELSDGRDLVAGRWVLAGNGFQSIACSEHTGIEIEAHRGRVPRRLERVDARVEIGIAIPARRLWEARQIGLGNRQALLYRVEHFLAARFEQATGHALDRAEEVASGRLLPRDVEELFVADHAERCAIELARDAVAPRNKLAQHGEFAAREVARALDTQKRIRRVVAGPARAFEQPELFLRPVPAAGGFELRFELVAQFKEIDRVLRGVVEHARGERTHGPVSALMLLVDLEAEVALEQRREAERLEPEQLRGDAGVEDVSHVPAVILLEKAEVVIGVVKYHLDGRVFEQFSHSGGRADGQWVDDGGLLACRELKQVDSIDEAMEARSFGIEREDAGIGNRGEETVDVGRRVEIQRDVWRGHDSNLTGTRLARSERMSESDNEHPTLAISMPPRRKHRRQAGFRSADILRTAALVIAMYLLVRLIWFAHPLFLTAFLGLLFGLAVSAGVDILARWRVPRGIGAALVVISFFGLLVGFGALLAPTIHRQGIELRRRLPDAIDRVEVWVNSHRDGVVGMAFSGLLSDARTDSASGTKPRAAATPAPDQNPASPTTPADSAAPEGGSLKSRVGNRFNGATRYLFPFLTSTVEVFAGLLIIVFLSIYIAVDPGMYRRGLMALFPMRSRARAGEVLSAIGVVLRRWLVTQLIAMATIGVVSTLVLLILHVKAAFALGLLSGLFTFIPTVGPIIAALPAIAMGFLDSPDKALYIGLAFVGVHFLESHILIPLLMKGGVDVPPALTILAQALMAMLFGFLGLMCAVPVLAATMVAVRMLYVEGVVIRKHLASPQHSLTGLEG
jgi:predicted PurR-regulated permease PerM